MVVNIGYLLFRKCLFLYLNKARNCTVYVFDDSNVYAFLLKFCKNLADFFILTNEIWLHHQVFEDKKGIVYKHVYYCLCMYNSNNIIKRMPVYRITCVTFFCNNPGYFITIRICVYCHNLVSWNHYFSG